jgi:hypothetical protein
VLITRDYHRPFAAVSALRADCSLRADYPLRSIYLLALPDLSARFTQSIYSLRSLSLCFVLTTRFTQIY